MSIDINCWFCYNLIPSSEISNQEFYEEIVYHCRNEKCQQCLVKYKCLTPHNINIVQFNVILNNHTYFINYWVPEKKLVVVVEVPNEPLLPRYETILEIVTERVILTLDNYKEKLPILLLFL